MEQKDFHNDSLISQKEELFKLVEYMVHHNAHHNEELKEISDKLDVKVAREKVEEAIKLFSNGNKKLIEALEVLREEK